MDRTSRENPDYYKVLGVVSTATPEEIEAAFRELARRWHPDVCEDVQHAAENFKRIAEAHEVLRDPEKRRRYDRQRVRSPAGTVRIRPRSAGETRRPEDVYAEPRPSGMPEDLFDLMRAFFGGSIGPQTVASDIGRGSRFELELPVSPEEAHRGSAVPIILTLPAECPACAGRSTAQKAPCDRCGGRGSVRGERCQVVVHVPPGVRTGTRLRTAVEGVSGSGAWKEVVFRIRVSPYV